MPSACAYSFRFLLRYSNCKRSGAPIGGIARCRLRCQEILALSASGHTLGRRLGVRNALFLMSDPPQVLSRFWTGVSRLPPDDWFGGSPVDILWKCTRVQRCSRRVVLRVAGCSPLREIGFYRTGWLLPAVVIIPSTRGVTPLRTKVWACEETDHSPAVFLSLGVIGRS